MMQKFNCNVVLAGMASVLLLSGTALADQAATPAGPAGSASWQQNADKMAEARRRYDLGLKLYEDGNYEASRIEFERAMALAPSYRILYNIGQAYKQLNNYVAAVQAFKLYLQEGGSEVPEDRKAAVQNDITELGKRIGQIRISTTAGAEISVDGVVVGKAPLAGPLPVNPGLRRFGAQLPGFLPATKTITVGSSENPELVLKLDELPKAKVIERKSNPWLVPTVVGWAFTGASAIGWGVTGGLALGAKSDQNDLLARQGVAPADLTSARDKTQTLGTVSDVLLITTAVGAGVSVFFTYKLVTTNKQEAEPKTAGTSVQFVAGPGSVGAVGTF